MVDGAPRALSSPATRLVALCGALLLARLVSAAVVAQPGYTDAYYYHLVAERLARGEGLTADFVWNLLEAPAGATLPVPSHRFWMPLATVIQAGGIALFGDLLGAFRAAQLAVVALAALVPVAAYAACRSLAGSERAALTAAALAGLGGAFAPGWVSLDSFAVAALVGTAFFLLYADAARADVRAAAGAGLCVGLLFLARAEGALFGLALLALPGRARWIGSGVALAIGLAWLGRSAALGPVDLLARSALLVRYEDFFARATPTLELYLAAMPGVLVAKLAALATNAQTFVLAFALVLVPPLAFAVRSLRDRPEVRAWLALAVIVYAVQSLVWTLHSTEGSYFHSLAALFPFGVALAVVGTRELAERGFAPPVVGGVPGAGARGVRILTRRLTAAAAATVVAFAALSAYAVAEWDRAFNTLYRERLAALPGLVDGPFLAVDAAAWRWISGRTAIVTPADGPAEAVCVMLEYGARSMVLEPIRFSAYEDLYRQRDISPFGFNLTHEPIRIAIPTEHLRCER